MRITDCAALVTGGASGLGLAVAERLAAGGARVVVADLADELPAGTGDGIVLCRTDVTDGASVEGAVAAAVATGPLRLLVSCAGIALSQRVLRRDATPHDLAAFRRVIDVNLVGTFNAVRLAARAMRENEPIDGDRGVIVNTASIAAFDGQIGQAAYTASKAAIAGMTLPLARDLADIGVRVVTIAPGMFATPMVAGLPDAARASLAQQVPHPERLGEPTEFAALVVHIVANSMLNGETIRLDGAARMAPR
jgi:NAD(P)-dependent dehydrogenase (short-subunit alcohol dehydrogenase family)